jgi:hypothetical protein
MQSMGAKKGEGNAREERDRCNAEAQGEPIEE